MSLGKFCSFSITIKFVNNGISTLTNVTWNSSCRFNFVHILPRHLSHVLSLPVLSPASSFRNVNRDNSYIEYVSHEFKCQTVRHYSFSSISINSIIIITWHLGKQQQQQQHHRKNPKTFQYFRKIKSSWKSFVMDQKWILYYVNSVPRKRVESK